MTRDPIFLPGNIVAAGLVDPKQGVFGKEVEHVLVVATLGTLHLIAVGSPGGHLAVELSRFSNLTKTIHMPTHTLSKLRRVNRQCANTQNSGYKNWKNIYLWS